MGEAIPKMHAQPPEAAAARQDGSVTGGVKGEEPKREFDRAREWVAAASCITVLTGAGISTDSGIPDFRGPNGLWTKNPAAEKASTLQHYLADPERAQARLAEPAALAGMDSASRTPVTARSSSWSARASCDAVVTQNIDELHQRAGHRPGDGHRGARHDALDALLDVRRPPADGRDARPGARRRGRSAVPRRAVGVLKSDTISFGQTLVPEVIDAAMRAAERVRSAAGRRVHVVACSRRPTSCRGPRPAARVSSSSTASRPKWTASPTRCCSGRSRELLPAIIDRRANARCRIPTEFGRLSRHGYLPRPAQRRQGGDHRGRHRRPPPSTSPPAPSCSTSASPTSTTRARCPTPSTSRVATSRPRSRASCSTRTRQVVVYCAGGVRSAFAAKTLQELGYTDVVSMAGGFGKWKDEGRPWKTPVVLTAEQRNRYQRHLLLPEVGVEGQAKLLDSKVLMLGAGGLGSPAALYLAAAGVGTIGIVDMDEVDASNLQRQILHNLDRIGDRKVDSAKKTLDAAEPRRRRGHLRHPPRRQQHHGHHRRLRRHRRRRRQLPQPLPAQRRQREARHPGGARLDLPLRGHGQRVPPAARARPTATWCPSRRPPSWRPAAPRPACSACCPASSAASRRSRSIKVLLGLGEPLIGRILSVDTTDMSFRTFNLRAGPGQRGHLREPRPHHRARARRALRPGPSRLTQYCSSRAGSDGTAGGDPRGCGFTARCRHRCSDGAGCRSH